MKKFALIAILATTFACNSTNTTPTETAVVSNFLEDISSLEDDQNKFPIQSFQKVANDQADKVIELTKSNIKDVLKEAEEYQHFVIVVGNHTIVKIEDITNCKQSGSWGACMPYGEGYIRKGKFVHQEDYINNIIGRPGGEKRTVYLFNTPSK